MNIYTFFSLLQLQCIIPTLLLFAIWSQSTIEYIQSISIFFNPAKVCELKPTNVDIEV